MPEGDTIFRSARTLHQALSGATVTGFETAYAPLAAVHDNTPLTGRVIEKVEAHGKWLLIHFSGDLILVSHMLMSGSWHIYRPGERWKRGRAHVRIVIRTANIEAVAFDVQVARFHSASSFGRHSAIPKLGPDLLGEKFDEDEAQARIRARANDEIANVLLNQQVMSGIGNVYKSEICFACGVHPFRLVSSLSDAEIDCLIDAARRFMASNVAESSSAGRRTTTNTDPAARLWVYGRQGRECRRCGSAILMRKQGTTARSSYWCPECQPSDVPVAGWANQINRRKIGCS
jgi:endonuclease-8